ncbi:ankyrin repeat and KH domain-containing protein 1-like [Haliotis cracherodii]|uniref:ankyrin repeat and KH domain-containing protein 1-like n=1 Tax=Haliotis cracherodii TaxID=6455 RepID=UPI0039EA5EBA
MASSDDLTIVLPTQDDLETMELITPEGIPQTINSGDVPHTITTFVGTQNIFIGPTGTVGEATLDLRIDDAKEIFVETESFRNVKRKLKAFGHVTICGASGEGKTTAALVLGSQYRQKGYKLAFVNRIEQFDLDSFLSSSPRVFLIVDDMFGTVGLSADVSQLTTILNTLYQHLQHCKRESEKRKQQTKKEGKDESKTSGVSDPKEHPTKDIRIIFTSKTYNFHAGLAQLQYERFSLFKSQTVMDLTTQKQHRYTQAEKKAIYEHHRNRHRKSSDEDCEDLPDYEDLDTDSNIFGIPLTCKLFFEFSSFTRNARNFFKEPLFYLKLELENLLQSKTDRSAILILMLLCEDKLDLAKLQADGKDQKLDIMVRTVLELRPKASRLGMHEAATTFRGTFFTRGDVVGFAHSSISDACACSLFDISPEFVLTHCSDNFIYERVQSQPVPETIIDDHLHLIYVSEAYHDILTTRFAESIKNGQFSKSVTHPILQQEQVALQLLEKLKHDGSMDECWVHKRENENCFLFWAVLGHNNNFVFKIENITREEFTQTEISEAMFGCVFKNNLTALKWLFSRSESPDIGINSLLLLAALTGSSEILVYLIENGANVLSTDADKKTIIHLACMAGHEKTLTVLKEHDIKLFTDELKDKVMNSTDNEGRTPLMVAALTGSNVCYRVLQSISNKKTKDYNGDDIVHLACKGGNEAIVQHLVSPSNINTRGQNGWTPVMMAAFNGHQSVFDLLVSKNADLTLVDNNGDSLLHLAYKGGNLAIVQHLVSPSNVNTRGQNGWTPVMIAALKGHQSAFDLLVSKDADLTLVDNNGDSLLHLACNGGNTAIVQHLVSPSNINTRGQNGWTPVMMAAFKGHQSVFDLLVSKNSDLTLVDNNRDSLLHLACYGGNTAIVQHRVSPSNVNTRGQSGWTPVMIAAFKGHQSVFDLLVSKDADLTLVDKGGVSLLHLACYGGNTAIVLYLVSPSNVNTRGQSGWTPVMIAAFKGYQSVFDLLVYKNADLTLVDNNGDSLLHIACTGGNTAIVQYVVSPSNINTRGQNGLTPVMMAAFTGHQSVFDLLVSKNADLTLVNKKGDSLLLFACKGGNTAIVQYLMSPSNINTRGQNGWTPVMMAAFKGHQSVFDLLVSKNADLTLVDNNGDSLLHLACYGGNTAIVQYAVSPSNVNSRGQNGWTPVMMAVMEGHQRVFDLLVSKNADLTLVDNNGDSLLHLACYGGNTAIVQYAVSPSNVNSRGQNGWTPVMMAAFKGHQSVFDLLVSKNAVPTLVDKDGNSLLHLACYGGNTAIVQYLVSPSNVNTRGQKGRTPLMMAVMEGHQSVLDLLVSKDADLTLVDKNSNSLLHLACYGGNTATVQYFVSPSNINTRGQNGWTPVMMAAFKGHQSAFDLLVSKHADLTLVDKDGNSLLHLACYGGNTAIVQYLVSPSNVNTRGQNGWTPVMMAVMEGHQSVFDLLVSKNADLTLVDKNGNSLLHLACYGGNTAIVQCLVSPSNVNTRGQNGWTPVMVAAFKGHQSVFDLLVSKDADLTLVDNNRDSLFCIACKCGNTAIVQYLMSPSNINTRGQNGWTPVMMAVMEGHQSVFDLLVSKNADLTLVDKNGNSLLHLACYGGNTAIVQYLVSPSNVNTRGQNGWTPVMVAAFKGHQSVFDLLVSKHADLTLVDNNRDSLFCIACKCGNTAIVQYLVSPSNINTRGQNGWTPVMMAVMEGHQSVFDLLVSKDADLTLVDKDSNSLLHLACYGGNTATVQYLVSPSNVNTRGQNGWTPVMMAAFKGHQSAFDLLVSKHADLTLVGKKGNSLLHLACYGGNTATVQYLVSPSNVNTRGENGWTPVMMAVMEGHQSVFDLLVSKHADLTLVSKKGDSLLHLACCGGNTAIVQYLVSPSNINTRGQNGWTPVMMAAVNGHQSVFELLVSKNADLTLVDNDSNSLLHLACNGGNTAIVQNLVSPSNVNTRGQEGWTPVMMAAFKGHQSVFDLLVSKNADLTHWIAVIIVYMIIPLVRSRQR